MQDSDFEAYLQLLGRLLRLSEAQRAEIRRELRAHVEDALRDAASRGEDPQTTLLRVLDDFGDAAELAMRFGEQSRKRRWMMHGTMVAACAAFALVSLNFWSPQAAPANAALPEGAAPRAALAAPVTSDSAGDAKIRTALRRVIDVSIDDQPLKEVFSYLAQTLGVNLHVQWRVLQDQGVNSDSPQTIHLKAVPIERVLQMVLDEEHNVQLAYAVQDGVLLVSTAERLQSYMRTQVYDVRALLAEFDPGQSTIMRESPDVPMAKPDTHSAGAPAHVNLAPIPETDAARALIRLIASTIQPDRWECNGGSASLHIFNGMLVVRQSEEVQSQVAQLLAQLRPTGANVSPAARGSR